MCPKLILMLSFNEKTSPEAFDYFEQVKDLPIDYFGIEENGLTLKQMQILNNKIRNAGFKSFLELAEHDEKELGDLLRIAVKMGFDYIIGLNYYPSVRKIINNKVKYFPFCGKIYKRPAILTDTIEEIVQFAKSIEDDVDGFNLTAYRYFMPEKVKELIAAVVKSIKVPVLCSGSINSFERLDEIIKQNVWGVIIGGAFFEKKFVPNGSFRENVLAVLKKLGKENI